MPADALERIARYYDACSNGDAEGVAETLCPDVVHWFLAPNQGSTPVHGAEHLGRYWRKVHGMIAPTWVVDHGICSGSEAVIEWSMFWQPADGPRVVTRGAEWFTFRHDKIAEIRSYYQQRAGDSELHSFPYETRGYSVHGAEHSQRHRPVLA